MVRSIWAVEGERYLSQEYLEMWKYPHYFPRCFQGLNRVPGTFTKMFSKPLTIVWTGNGNAIFPATDVNLSGSCSFWQFALCTASLFSFFFQTRKNRPVNLFDVRDSFRTHLIFPKY